MGILFRDREQDLADPDLRSSRYFLFKNKQTEENKLKNAERKYGYSLGELHAYKHLMKPPQMPERMQEERPDMRYTYEQIDKLIEVEEYQQQTENHFATKPGRKPWTMKQPLDESSRQTDASDVRSKVASSTSQHANGVDESCIKCLGYYLALDRCVRAVSKEDEKNRVYKYTRLHACKPHWVWFKRCTGYRDQQLLNEIFAWEGGYVQSLETAQRREYAEKLHGVKRYLEYASARSRDNVELVRMQREASHVAARVEKLYESGAASEAPSS